MRTTVNLDEDVVRIARRLAQERGQSIGRVVSDYFRKGLEPGRPRGPERNGIPLLPRRGDSVVTPETVRELLDADE